MRILVFPLVVLGVRVERPFIELFQLTTPLSDLVLLVAVITSLLYVLVRGGTLLIDHYHRTVRPRSGSDE
ncbi:hypothetical protein EA462_03555 [Natrarchaeobius halalkaliphilus]|uniref:Uncharacterized protein n=1 Tax=Natrarchaeobius halalkaliphilus TaxID=1679091 RepID=A0A3N6N156_9EURY|nr:hypothetical protein EA462_03555 [Natrarchaeobius halalkaliphilus]